MDEQVRTRLKNFAIGAAVHRTRNQRGVPDYQLARQLRVLTQTLLSYESGDEAIPAPVLYEIAEALRTPIDELFRDYAAVQKNLSD